MIKSLTTVLSVMVLCFCFQSNAQITTPAPSPAAKVKQTVGLTEVVIQYSRPGVKGRTIFAEDGLVPYGKIWRTGANAATKITFSDDVTIEGHDLKKGSYALLTIPSATTWDVMFYMHDSGNFGSYVEKEPDLKVTVTPNDLSPISVQSFSMGIGDLTDNGGTISMFWDNVHVPVKLGVNTDEAVMASIKKTLGGPSGGDYYTAGIYLYNSGKDKEKALKYVQKATHNGEARFWQLRWEAEILASMGKTAEAIKVAKQSIELAEKAGNSDHVKINTDNIAKWNM